MCPVEPSRQVWEPGLKYRALESTFKFLTLSAHCLTSARCSARNSGCGKVRNTIPASEAPPTGSSMGLACRRENRPDSALLETLSLVTDPTRARAQLQEQVSSYRTTELSRLCTDKARASVPNASHQKG